MRPKLVFITGAPGVGKNTVARLVFARLDGCAWLDGDDVWRMNPFVVDDRTIRIVEANITFVLRSYLAAGFRHVIFTWVLHRQDIIDRLVAGLEGLEHDLSIFTLVCDEATLAERRGRRNPGDAQRVGLAFERLRQSRELATPKIDTTGRTPEEAAEEILAALAADDGA